MLRAMASFHKPTPPLPATMRAMEVRGGALHEAQLPLPPLAAGELLIRVAYAGVNRADILQRAGKYPPPPGASPLPGLEVSGSIAAIGEGVSGWQVGDDAVALLAGGGYAEYVAVPAGQVLALPPSLNLQEGAALVEAAATAVMALDIAQLKSGERLLIHGGTSGLGLMVIQIARAWGAEVFTTVGSDEKIAFLASYGVTALNHRTAPFEQQLMTATKNEGVDVIIDTLGAPYLERHFSLLRRGGRMVSLAMMEGAKAENIDLRRLLTHHLQWTGTTLRSRSTLEKSAIIAAVAARVLPHVASGAIRPIVDSVFALAEAEKALARMQERLHLGKILLEVAAK